MQASDGKATPASSFSFSTSSIPDSLPTPELTRSNHGSSEKFSSTSFNPRQTTYADAGNPFADFDSSTNLAESANTERYDSETVNAKQKQLTECIPPLPATPFEGVLPAATYSAPNPSTKPLPPPQRPPRVPDDEEAFAGWLALWKKKAAAKQAETGESEDGGELRSPTRNTRFYGFYDDILPGTPKEGVGRGDEGHCYF